MYVAAKEVIKLKKSKVGYIRVSEWRKWKGKLCNYNIKK